MKNDVFNTLRVDFYGVTFNYHVDGYHVVHEYCPLKNLANVVIEKCRRSPIDPLYRSTDNWKTKKQWESLGFVVPKVENVYAHPRVLVGYAGGECQGRVVRYHRSIVRKK